MDERMRFAVYWEGGENDPGRMATRLSMLLTALKGVDPAFSPFVLDGHDRALAGAELGEAIAGKARAYAFGKAERVAYDAAFTLTAGAPAERDQEPAYIGDPSAKPARVAAPLPGAVAGELRLLFGLEPVAYLPVYLPNRLELLVHRGLGKDGVTRIVAETVIKTIATALKPDWGTVGTPGAPAPLVATRSDGRPDVAWMTFLSNRHPVLPELEEPAAARPVGSVGTLLIADPRSLAPKDPEQRARIEALRTQLDRAGVLIDGVALRGR